MARTISCIAGLVLFAVVVNAQCPPGQRYSTYLDQCFPCADGSYQNETGRTTCYRCPNGQSTLNDAATSISACVACSAGTYQELWYVWDQETIDPSDQESRAVYYFNQCIDCEAEKGQYSAVSGRTACALCSTSGSGVSHPAVSCSTCAVGKYSKRDSTTGGYYCSPCDAGAYQPSTGQTSCYACNAGTQPNLALTECFTCQPGTYSSDGNWCEPCGWWLTSDQYGSSDCTVMTTNFKIVLGVVLGVGFIACCCCCLQGNSYKKRRDSLTTATATKQAEAQAQAQRQRRESAERQGNAVSDAELARWKAEADKTNAALQQMQLAAIRVPWVAPQQPHAYAYQAQAQNAQSFASANPMVAVAPPSYEQSVAASNNTATAGWPGSNERKRTQQQPQQQQQFGQYVHLQQQPQQLYLVPVTRLPGVPSSGDVKLQINNLAPTSSSDNSNLVPTSLGGTANATANGATAELTLQVDETRRRSEMEREAMKKAAAIQAEYEAKERKAQEQAATETSAYIARTLTVQRGADLSDPLPLSLPADTSDSEPGQSRPTLSHFAAGIARGIVEAEGHRYIWNLQDGNHVAARQALQSDLVAGLIKLLDEKPGSSVYALQAETARLTRGWVAKQPPL